MRNIKIPYLRMSRVVDEIRSGINRNCTTLSVELEISARSILRDIAYLKDVLGAPIEYSYEEKGYYLTDVNWCMPYRITSKQDMLALVLGAKLLASLQGCPLSDSIRGLPMDENVSLEGMAAKFAFRSGPARKIDPLIWLNLARSTAEQYTCGITYYSPRRCVEEFYRIYPHLMANIEGEWYVWGYLVSEQKIRQFAVAHVQEVMVSDETFMVRDDYVPEDLIRNSFGKYAHAADEKRRQVTLLFDAELNHYISENQWHPEQKLGRAKDGRTRLQFPYVKDDDLFNWILGFGADVEVIHPKSLKNMVEKEVARLCALYNPTN